MNTTINHELSNRGWGNNIYRRCERRIIPTTHPIIQTPGRKLFGIIIGITGRASTPEATFHHSFTMTVAGTDTCWPPSSPPVVSLFRPNGLGERLKSAGDLNGVDSAASLS